MKNKSVRAKGADFDRLQFSLLSYKDRYLNTATVTIFISELFQTLSSGCRGPTKSNRPFQ